MAIKNTNKNTLEIDKFVESPTRSEKPAIEVTSHNTYTGMYFDATYPTTTRDVITWYTDSTKTTLFSTITINYTDTTKKDILNFEEVLA